MKRWFWLALILPVAIWLVSMLPQGGPGSDFWTLRGNSIILSGIVAYSLMALITLLATRPMWLEDLLGGLDQSYRLHKWLGITAGVLVFVHWMMEIVPKSIAKAG
ncbi:ferric reductase-like transmembrane domain-containing protein [Pseudomonas sp. EggHat1]|uniref:ferric reductase-like transmembrane domain-containing protein n=1 Tax=Pseudomonas sp. EggHat1 TaxID=2761624 RepID=UPI001868085E|nr:ferric reductase-like transmembrane domain-containing protein [Pseudomonas sp. EggHat1]